MTALILLVLPRQSVRPTPAPYVLLMLNAILILLGCQLAGEIAARGLGLPIPGPVIGMALLFAGLQARERWRPAPADVQGLPLGAVAAFLLAHLSLLFVPAGTGIIAHAATLSQHGAGLIVALVVSTALTLAVTAAVFVAVARRVNAADPSPGADDARG